MIYFDNIIYSLQPSGGISVYWNELLSHVITNKEFNYQVIEYRDAKQRNYFRKNLNIPTAVITTLNSKFLKIKRYINPHIDCSSPFIFHSSYYRVCQNKKAINICTVHDFTYEYHAKGIRRTIHNWQKYNAIKKSNYIICISEHTKKDLLKFLPNTDTNKIRVIHNGVSTEYKQLNINDLKNQLPYTPYSYALFVGERGLYKNFNLAVEGIAQTNLNLVIIGKTLTPDELLFLNKSIGKNRYIQLNNISNIELNLLYNGAFCLLYPSSYEGFGIPIIEAQKAGCPVVAYDTSSISEIIGNTPLLMRTLDINEIRNKLKILENNKIRDSIIKNGLENATKFSWEKTYNQLKAIYQEALNSNL